MKPILTEEQKAGREWDKSKRRLAYARKQAIRHGGKRYIDKLIEAAVNEQVWSEYAQSFVPY